MILYKLCSVYDTGLLYLIIAVALQVGDVVIFYISINRISEKWMYFLKLLTGW